MRANCLLSMWFTCGAMFASPAHAMDQARVETRVDVAVARFGVTGHGVIVAILDRGVDWGNKDFRNTNGSTRIASMLDITADSGSNSPANAYGMGTIYTRQQIDGALTYATRSEERRVGKECRSRWAPDP